MLRTPPHTVTVQPRRPVKDAHGTRWETVGDPVTVPCIVRAVSATESNIDGVTAQTLKRVIAAKWPGDIHSLVLWQGSEYEPEGEPQTFDGSARTAHVEVLLRKVP